MWSARFTRFALPAFSAAAAVSLGTYKRDNDALSEGSAASVSGKDESLCVYLSMESRAHLAEHLHKMGVNTPVNKDLDDVRVQGRDVVVKAKLSDIDSYVYSPLYGERAAFRLKTLITTEEGEVVGTGRVSNLTGELFDEEYEASVILRAHHAATAGQSQRRAFLHDLPTRLYQSHALQATAGTKPWKGTVRGGAVLNRTYEDTTGVTVRALPSVEQLVIDGRVCSSKYANAEEGTCSFDRADVPSQAPPPGITDRRLSSAEHPHSNKTDLQKRRDAQLGAEEGSSDESAEEESCPVCRYMKGGPCKKEFIAWDGCIQGLKDGDDVKQCYNVTAAMMGCMQGHEYYDPMTANQQRPSA